MNPSEKFKLKEREVSNGYLYGYCTGTTTIYDIVRDKDDKTIQSFEDYLQALRYLEELEDLSWLVS